MKKPEIHFPTLIGILVAGFGLAAGVVLLKNPLGNLVRASPEETPQQTKITNTTDSEFVVSWTTAKAVSGFIQYGQKHSTPLVVSDDRDQEKGSIGNYFTHFVTVKSLKPSTGYEFKIGSGRAIYDQQGQAYQVRTGPQLANPPAADVAYGQVSTTSGDAADGAIVYVLVTGMTPQAALVKATGSWVIPLATGRTTDLTSFVPYDPQTTNLEIFVEGGPLGSSQVTTTTSNDKPVANIVLGSNQDLTAAITPAPENPASASSKFSSLLVSAATEASGAANLSILTPKFGEKVNSTEPEIIGRGPANTNIEIEIHSTEAISGTVTTDSNGNWSYSVPSSLTPGEHTVTITTLVNGVAKKITRSFVVQAAGESNNPALSATASATLAPTRLPTPTPTVTVTVTVTPTPQPALPAAGNLTPTLLLAILGFGLICAGALAYGSIR